jgi:hypothetical protein
VGRDVLPRDASLPTAATRPFRGGSDRYGRIAPDDAFEPGWTLGWDGPASGVHALVGIEDLATVVVPDLYSPQPLAAHEAIVDPRSLAGPTFEPCVDLPPPPAQARGVPDQRSLRLDPALPHEREQIVQLQLRLEDLAETLRSFVVLLDVPPRLHQRAILDWRARFSSSFAAAYHPWLRVSRGDDARDALVRVNPAAVAAGIVARPEVLYGVPLGPSKELAAGVGDVDAVVSPPRHDELNPQAIVDAGRLVAEVGVAPAEPLEFIVLRLSRDGDGTVRAEGGGA